MKRVLSLAFALLLSISVSAQTTLTEAVNFTATAHNGEQIDLFEILDGGQYVLMDFFFTTCGPCKISTPKIVDAYYNLGCNEGDIYFMEISPSDHNNGYFKFVDEWIETYDIPFPTLHTGTGGATGDSIYRMYDIKACPTIVLIAPDRKIVLQDYSPESAEKMVEYLTTTFEIEEKYCGNQTPSVSVATTKVGMEDGQGHVLEASTKVHVDFRANAAVDKFYYHISTSKDLTSETVIAEGTLAEQKEFSHTFEGLKELTNYYVYAQAVGFDGVNGELSVLETRTLCPGDDGEAIVELSVNISASHVSATAKPNESTSEYHFGFVRKAYYDESEENQFIFLNKLAHDDYPYCDRETYDVEIENIPVDTVYYVVAVARNGEGEWFAPSITEFEVKGTALSELEGSFEVYPNPASSTINIKSALNGEAQINIVDVTGRCVKQVSVADLSNVAVSVEDLNKGVYFISIEQDNNYNIQKLVVE